MNAIHLKLYHFVMFMDFIFASVKTYTAFRDKKKRSVDKLTVHIRGQTLNNKIKKKYEGGYL